MNKANLMRMLSVVSVLASAALAHAQGRTSAPVPAEPSFASNDAGERGEAIANYLESFGSGWMDAYQQARLTIYDREGGTTTRDLVSLIRERAGGNQSLVRFMSPADVRGVGTLIHERIGGTDNTWLYLPANRRTRRVAGANRTSSFQGTEFTYEDLSTFEVRRYSWRALGDANVTVGGEQHAVYRLEALPSHGDTGYSKLIVDVNRAHWRVERIQYFDQASRLLKVLTSSRWQHIHGRFWRPGRLDMRNRQTQKRTVIDFRHIRLNLVSYSGGRALGADALSRRALERP